MRVERESVFSMEYYAHSNDSDNRATWQTLQDHLVNVSELAAGFAAEFGQEDAGRALGLLHDVGKRCPAFLRRLEGSAEHVDHSTAGAKIAVARYGDTAGSFLSYSLCGHHGGMPNGIKRTQASRKGSLSHSLTPLRDRLAKSVDGVDDMAEFASTLSLPSVQQADFVRDKSKYSAKASGAHMVFSFYLLEKFLYSTLVDADYLDTEKYATPEQAMLRERPRPTLASLNAALRDRMESLMNGAAKERAVNIARRSIYEDCLDSAGQSTDLFTLTVPTGGGKTLSSLAFALKHALANGQKRIIYVAPFTTIIEQTARVFKKIFGEDAVLEHHSNYAFDDLSDDDSKLACRLAVQNWDAPIVVTTNVQLFESIYANRPGKSRKLHNIVNSVIVLDEAQTLPDELLLPTLAALEELAWGYSTSVVLCTATQPTLNDHWPFGSNPKEIVKRTEGFDEAFKNRVDFEVLGDVEEEDLVSRIIDHDQALCIVGTKKEARSLYDAVLQREREAGVVASENERPFDSGIFHLSAFMTPEHRTEMLDAIRTRLDPSPEGVPLQRCIVISTQLVEAGVDLDFPVVFREMAGLDSVMQAAGRCNREGRLPCATVHVFDYCIDSKRQKTLGWLEKMKDIGRAVLEQNEGVLDDDAVARFFARRYQAERLDAKGIFKELSSLDIVQSQFKCFSFEQYAIDYQLIEDDAVAVFVPRSQEGRKLRDQLLAADVPAKLANRLRRHCVSVPRWLIDRFDDDAIDFLEPFYLLKIDDGCRSFYREDVGLLLPGEEEWKDLIM
ncbi:MAG: CRISPR-associated helicase Cas3' [Raoultibacter sp.]